MGPGPLFAARLGHLLLLHLEGRQIHWKGKKIYVLVLLKSSSVFSEEEDSLPPQLVGLKESYLVIYYYFLLCITVTT